MKNLGNNIRISLQKREKAINGFNTKRAAFKAFRNNVIKDIDEARGTWMRALEQLPDHEFNK